MSDVEFRHPDSTADPTAPTDTAAVAVAVTGDRIRSIVERVERLEEEIRDLMAAGEVFAEARGEGLDVTVPREIPTIRRQDEGARGEQETLLEVDLRARDAPAPLAAAA